MEYMVNHNTKGQEVINSDLLLLWGAVLKDFDKDEYIFREGQHPQFYHQIIQGKIKMVNELENGKDFIQGFFSTGQSFGEPPIFSGGSYPASAVAVQSTIVLRLSIPSFMKLLRENFDVHLGITTMLCQRLKNKALALKWISCLDPEHRILSLLDNFKRESLPHDTPHQKVKIEYTRRQIAAMTGMRVETVIRVMRKLFDKRVLSIKNGKVFY